MTIWKARADFEVALNRGRPRTADGSDDRRAPWEDGFALDTRTAAVGRRRLDCSRADSPARGSAANALAHLCRSGYEGGRQRHEQEQDARDGAARSGSEVRARMSRTDRLAPRESGRELGSGADDCLSSLALAPAAWPGDACSRGCVSIRCVTDGRGGGSMVTPPRRAHGRGPSTIAPVPVTSCPTGSRLYVA
jgi:hypothetical protein